jgi:outer membrane protein insertion porin family
MFLKPEAFPQETIPTKISSIDFNGNEYFTSNQLQEMIVLKPGAVYSDAQFDLDLKNIIDNYQRAGLIDCRIEKWEKSYNFDSSGISLSVNIQEGKQVQIGEIVFEGNKTISSLSLLNNMYTKAGKVLDQGSLNQDLEQILDLYEKKGFAFASIYIKDISVYSNKEQKNLRITIRIDENEKIKINDIVIEGNTTTKRNVILREIRMDRNTTVTKETLIEIKRHLENIGYFESVEQPKILKYKNSTVLLIKVAEGSTNTFDGIVGYVPPAADEDKGYFTGLINLSLKNLFGTGRRIDAKWQKELKSTQELELKYLEPWILGYPLTGNIGFLQRIQDSTYIKRNISGKFDALISRRFTVSAFGYFERVIPTIANNQSGFQLTVFDSRLITAGAEIRYDSRDYVYNPSSGVLYRTSYSAGQKKIYNAASFQGLDVPGDFTVQRGMLDLDFYYSLFKRQSSLISLHGVEVRSPRLEDADYFRLGGSRTVRGYREEQFLASRTAWANFELRYSLTRKTFASIFYDAGYYQKPFDEIVKSPEQKGFIFGYGLGIRVETPLGIFGVSYALGKGDGMLEGKVHFGLINDF